MKLGWKKRYTFCSTGLFSKKGLPPTQGGISVKFDYPIRQLSQKSRVVVLIDEYDAPNIHYLGKNLDAAYAKRAYMGKLQLGRRGDRGVGLITEVLDQAMASKQTTQFTGDFSDTESDVGVAWLIAAYKNLLAVSPHL